MRQDLFDELLQSVREMKAIQAGRAKPARVTRSEDLLGDTPDGAPSPPRGRRPSD